MKRYIILVFGLLTLMAASVSAYNPYAPNQFDTMEHDTWEYKTTCDLTKAGLTGADMSKFSPKYDLTRYEMAQMVEEAIKNRAQATASQQKDIDKLAEAFASDLEYMHEPSQDKTGGAAQTEGQNFDWRQGTTKK